MQLGIKKNHGTVLLAVLCFSIMLVSETRACRLYGAISDNLPEGLFESHLVTEPNSFKALSSVHTDGWGIGYFLPDSTVPVVARGAVRAHNDPDYDDKVSKINGLKPDIMVGHIRLCTSGCCESGADSIADPHPFSRSVNGKNWLFVHNGSASKNLLTELMGEPYLEQQAPYGEGVAACAVDDPASDLVIDSEFLFLFLLKEIEESGEDNTTALLDALKKLIIAGEKSTLNFILSDGTTLWVFRRAKQGKIWQTYSTLYYLYDQQKEYAAIASEYPSENRENWRFMENYALMVFKKGKAPESYHVDACGDDSEMPAGECSQEEDDCGDLYGEGYACGSFCTCDYFPLSGDADGDKDFDFEDLVAVIKTVFGFSEAEGNPDCNSDRSVNLFDIWCAMAKLFNLIK